MLADVTMGLERFCGRYYGIYPGVCVENRDPECRGRILATCPAININKAPDVGFKDWIVPCMPGAGATEDGILVGQFHPPEIGANVWLQFQFGDPRQPVYMGGWIASNAMVNAFKTDEKQKDLKRGIVTRTGHFIRFDDDLENLNITIARGDGSGEPTPMMLSFTMEGHVQLSNLNGSYLFMNAFKNETTLATVNDTGEVTSMLVLGDDEAYISTKSGGIFGLTKKDALINAETLTHAGKTTNLKTGKVLLGDGANEPVPKGTQLSLWSSLHMHTSSAPGVATSPPPPPFPTEGKELSAKVFVA
jgi:hypothetical protein